MLQVINYTLKNNGRIFIKKKKEKGETDSYCSVVEPVSVIIICFILFD